MTRSGGEFCDVGAVIWDALKAAFTGDANMREVIIRSAGIIVGNDDLSVLYDETGKQLCFVKNLVHIQSRFLCAVCGDCYTGFQ